ncbi:MAG: LysM peptidoglycan-binding domain-containing protein [Clostridiales bacterium]|nr:LysM peptidoglycan-binding domain-containing protein [Clostridiales bacterium]
MADRSDHYDNLITVSEKANLKVKTPKNVRQIGKIGDGLKIYIEDYVKTYTKQLAEGDYTNHCIAVLVGEYRNTDQERNVFLYGAIKVETEEVESQNIFTEEVWTIIYEKIKEYFPEAEIVGWYYGGTGLENEDLQRLEQIQINNFAGRDKVLFTYDALEKEHNFYLFDGVSMVLQSGYYIYYEKNEEMQNYMVDHKRIRREEEQVNDHATRAVKTILTDKKTAATPERDQKQMLRLGYAAGTLMLVVALIVGVTMFNNNRRMKDLEGDLQVMKNNIFEKELEAKETEPKEESKVVSSISDQNKVQTQITKQPTKENIVLTPTPVLEPTKAVTEAEPTKVISEPTKVVPSPTTVPEPTTQPVSNIDPSTLTEYTVKAGDTLASICIQECGSYGVITTVKDLNQIKNEDVIYVGQVILLPKKSD